MPNISRRKASTVSRAYITPEQIKAFDEYVKEVADLLNLRDWRIENAQKYASRGVCAEVSISLEDRLATYAIGRDWRPMPINDRTLRDTAVHELLHVFLRPLMQACADRDERQAQALEHSVITVLEKLLSKG